MEHSGTRQESLGILRESQTESRLYLTGSDPLTSHGLLEDVTSLGIAGVKTQAETNPATHWELCISRKAWDKLYQPRNLLESSSPSNPSCHKYHHLLTKAKCTMGDSLQSLCNPSGVITSATSFQASHR